MPISPFAALTVNIYGGVNGLNNNGARGVNFITSPSVPGAYFRTDNPAGVFLISGVPIDFVLTYSNLNATLELTQGAATFTRNFAIDVPSAVVSQTAFFGFTGSTATGTSTQQISNFSLVPEPTTLALLAVALPLLRRRKV